MPRFDLKTHILIFMQRTEHRIISSTAHYIPKIFKHAEIRIRGGIDRLPMNTDGIFVEERQPLILYPTENAQVLSEEFVSKIKKPITLIVPDGSWRQTMRIVKRLDPNEKIPRVILPPGPPSNYRLRTSRKEGGVCTFEAIARSLGIIEGKIVQEKLETFFDAMVERVLWTRGRLK
jgi:DTW domain-containing protein YfiP